MGTRLGEDWPVGGGGRVDTVTTRSPEQFGERRDVRALDISFKDTFCWIDPDWWIGPARSIKRGAWNIALDNFHALGVGQIVGGGAALGMNGPNGLNRAGYRWAAAHDIQSRATRRRVCVCSCGRAGLRVGRSR